LGIRTIKSGSYTWRKPSHVDYSHVFPAHRLKKLPRWNDLAASAYNSLPFQNNGLAYVKDFIGMKDMALKTAQDALSLLNGKKFKAIANLYLAFHYGWKLQVMDTKEFASGLSSFLEPSRLSASGQYWAPEGFSINCTYQVYYLPYEQLSSMLAKLFYYFDLSIDLSNVWDMTPWSFVVDWFFNIGDVLQTIDNYNSLIQRHRVTDVGRSTKAQRELKPSQIGLSADADSFILGKIIASYYDRSYNTTPIPPTTNLSTGNLSTTVHQHWVEGSSLFISNF